MSSSVRATLRIVGNHPYATRSNYDQRSVPTELLRTVSRGNILRIVRATTRTRSGSNLSDPPFSGRNVMHHTFEMMMPRCPYSFALTSILSRLGRVCTCKILWSLRRNPKTVRRAVASILGRRVSYPSYPLRLRASPDLLPSCHVTYEHLLESSHLLSPNMVLATESIPITRSARDSLIAVSVLWVVFAAVVGFRIYGRLRGPGLAVDDILAVAALVSGSPTITCSGAGLTTMGQILSFSTIGMSTAGER